MLADACSMLATLAEPRPKNETVGFCLAGGALEAEVRCSRGAPGAGSAFLSGISFEP